VVPDTSEELPAVGDSVDIRLEGEIRNASPLVECVRVGIDSLGSPKRRRQSQRL